MSATPHPHPEDGPIAKTPRRSKRRIATEEKLIQAVGALLREGGVDALGVNAVAREAGVDKVLIYRYFDGLEGLLTRYSESVDFWPSIDEILGPDREVLADPDPQRVAGRIMANYARAIRSRPVTVQLLAWECNERNALTIAVEDVRERWATQLNEEMLRAGLPLTPQFGVLAALFTSAIHYLAIRSRSIQRFGGVDVGSDAGWDAMIETMERAFGAFYPPDTPSSPS